MTASAHRAHSGQLTFERERGVYDLLVARDLAHVVVTVGDDDERTGRVLRTFRTLADESIPVFLIKLHRTAVSFAVEASHVPHVEQCLRDVAFECAARPNLALVTIVATSMRDLTGVMVRIADSLQRAGARLYGVGDSHNTVQCLVAGEHIEAAVRELERTFDLEPARG